MSRETRFQIAYFLLGLGVGIMLAVLAVTGSSQKAIQRDYGPCTAPIANKTWPNDIECHFRGDPLHTFPANLIPGMPQDGYCKDWSNQVSWRVFVCMGTQPETQP